MFYIYLSPKHQFPKGIWMIHVEEIKLLLLPGNRFQPNLVHILLYVCVRILCIYYIYIPQGGWCGRQEIWMIGIVEEIKLLLLLGNRLKHIRGNVRYLVMWNVKVFTVGYST
jgi:hypothetical protein